MIPIKATRVETLLVSVGNKCDSLSACSVGIFEVDAVDFEVGANDVDCCGGVEAACSSGIQAVLDVDNVVLVRTSAVEKFSVMC